MVKNLVRSARKRTYQGLHKHKVDTFRWSGSAERPQQTRRGALFRQRSRFYGDGLSQFTWFIPKAGLQHETRLLSAPVIILDEQKGNLYDITQLMPSYTPPPLL